MSSSLHQKTELIVALDFPDEEKALALVRDLKGLPITYKVGLELFISQGPQIVTKLIDSGFSVFLDLKLHDIPHTVAKAVRQAVKLRVKYLTVHLSGGEEMVKGALREIEAVYAAHPVDHAPKVLGVSVLTSFDVASWSSLVSLLAVDKKTYDPSHAVVQLAKNAVSWGVSGLVCSPQELSLVKKAASSLFTVTPGIRLEGDKRSGDDQARTLTPGEAASLGAGAIVVGRPITQTKDPRKVAELILQELSMASLDF